MTFPDHGGQETAYIQQIGDRSWSCICGGEVEVMSETAIFLHHSDNCPEVKAWLERCRELSKMQDRFGDYAP